MLSVVYVKIRVRDGRRRSFSAILSSGRIFNSIRFVEIEIENRIKIIFILVEFLIVSGDIMFVIFVHIIQILGENIGI